MTFEVWLVSYNVAGGVAVKHVTATSLLMKKRPCYFHNIHLEIVHG